MRIKWLHLSDIHFSYRNYKSALLRLDFIKRITQLSQGEPFTHLFLTGDLLFKYGEPNEDTTAFIRDLADAMGISDSNIFIVPGNHDHDRDISRNLISQLFADKKIEEIRSTIDDLEELKIAEFLRAFNKYDELYCFLLGKEYNAAKLPHVIQRSGDLTVIKLNTAWLDKDSDETESLFCGRKQLFDLLNANAELLKKSINIAIGHHPLENLEEQERNDITDLFKRYNIGLYFCGHSHKPSIKYNVDCDVLQLTCPGAYYDGYSTGGYVWGIIDTDASFYKAEFYNWNEDDWCIESKLKGTNERGILYFNTKRYKHSSNIAAIDLKIYDGHIARKEIESSIGCEKVDIHSYDVRNCFDWKLNEKMIENLAGEIKHMISHNSELHIYPMAPIPTLIKLGFELQNNSSILIHQYDRESGKWVYDGPDENVNIKYTEKVIGSNNLVVKVSTSVEINNELIKTVLPSQDYDEVAFATDNIAIGKPIYKDSVRKVAEAVTSFLNKSVSKYNNIHLFAAIPAGLAIELGRHMLRSIYYNVHLYNLNRNKYEHAIVLNAEEDQSNY